MNLIGKTLAAVAVLSVAAAPAFAQQLNSGATGTYGQVRLTSGFEPDPHTVTVSGGGALDASTVNEECRGYINNRPTFSLRYRAGDLPLYIGATSDADTTIVVRAPNGEWHCDDDSGGNLNPLVSWEEPASGRYQIWVGRFGTENETAAAVLNISEVGGSDQTAETGGPDFSLEPAYGAIDLAAGFLPDPHTMGIAAGGEIDASVLGVPGCVGWIAQAPDYRVNWTAGSNGGPLIFSVAAEADTTLVINDSEGNWICDDDGGQNGLNPAITFNGAASGQYDVWIGTYTQGDLSDSVLHVSEDESQ